jgi:hypothetical protein
MWDPPTDSSMARNREPVRGQWRAHSVSNIVRKVEFTSVGTNVERNPIDWCIQSLSKLCTCYERTIVVKVAGPNTLLPYKLHFFGTA